MIVHDFIHNLRYVNLLSQWLASDVDVCALSHLKEELARAADQHLLVISTIMLLKTAIVIRT